MTKKKHGHEHDTESGGEGGEGSTMGASGESGEPTPTNREYTWSGRATHLGDAAFTTGGELADLPQELRERSARLLRVAIISAQRRGVRLSRVPEVDVFAYENGHTHVVLRDGEHVLHEVTMPVGIAAVGGVAAAEDTRTDEERNEDEAIDAAELRDFLKSTTTRELPGETETELPSGVQTPEWHFADGDIDVVDDGDER